MAVNLTITVPEELHKRLQKVKKNSFNVSRVCQEAIEVEVKRRELLISGLDDMKDVIERLRLEKQELKKEAYDLGYKYGLEALKTIFYQELVCIGESSGPEEAIKAIYDCLLQDDDVINSPPERQEWQSRHLCTTEDDAVSNFLEAFGTEENLNYYKESQLDDELFQEGYFQAIIDFYGKIKDQL